MLGLGNSLSSANAAAVGEFTLPVNNNYNNNYINLFSQHIINSNNITGDDGVAPNREAQVISATELVFDDTLWEQYSFAMTGTPIYLDQSGIYATANHTVQLGSGDSATLSGKITQADTTNTYEAANANASLQFLFNADADDKLTVYIDNDNNSDISSDTVTKVGSDGTFSFTFTFNSDMTRFRLQSGSVGIEAASGDPGVRVSELRLIKN